MCEILVSTKKMMNELELFQELVSMTPWSFDRTKLDMVLLNIRWLFIGEQNLISILVKSNILGWHYL